MSETLDRCKFCGGKAAQEIEGVHCKTPGCALEHIWLTPAAWNTGPAAPEGSALREAVAWALGERDDFPPRQEGEGPYWWRKELRRRAALATPTAAGEAADAGMREAMEWALKCGIEEMNGYPLGTEKLLMAGHVTVLQAFLEGQK